MLAERGITRLMVEGGPTRGGVLRRRPIWSMRPCCSARPQRIGADGIDALEGLPLDGLDASPHLHRVGASTIGPDSVEHFERT